MLAVRRGATQARRITRGTARSANGCRTAPISRRPTRTCGASTAVSRDARSACLLPDRLAARLPGRLAEVEASVRAMEQARTLSEASKEDRLGDTVLPISPSQGAPSGGFDRNGMADVAGHNRTFPPCSNSHRPPEWKGRLALLFSMASIGTGLPGLAIEGRFKPGRASFRSARSLSLRPSLADARPPRASRSRV